MIFIGGTGGAGAVSDTLFDAAGDLLVGTGPDTGAKFTMGSALQTIRVNAGGTALEYFTRTTVNGLTITSSTGTLTIAALKTLTASNTLTLAGTDGSTLNVGTGGTLGALALLSTATVVTGGTGLGTLTANNLIVGAGTSNVTFIAPGTSGNVLTSNGTTWASTAPAAGGASVANPGGGSQVDLTGANGSAATALRSDAKLILDVTIAPTWSGLQTFTAGLTMSGNRSASAWTTNGIGLLNSSGTLTDTTSSGTVATGYTNLAGGNTIAASSATTFTNYVSSFFKAPTAGTNVTLTNKWGLGAESLFIKTTTADGSTALKILDSTGAIHGIFRDNGQLACGVGYSGAGNVLGIDSYSGIYENGTQTYIGLSGVNYYGGTTHNFRSASGGTVIFTITGANGNTSISGTLGVTGATTLTGLLTCNGGLSISGAQDIVLSGTTGTKLGTATTQKLGFWNVTPIAQPAAALQAALTNSTGGTQDGTLVDVTTAAVSDPVKVNSNFTDVFALLDAIRTALVNSGIMKGAA